jgi:hypothetical protein
MPQFVLVYPNMVRVFPDLHAQLIKADSHLVSYFIWDIGVCPNEKSTIGTLAAHDFHSDKGRAPQYRACP